METYSAEQLKKNRAAVMVFGGSEADRRAFATQAALAFPEEGPLIEARDEATLKRAIGVGRGVVYVPDATQLTDGLQREVVRSLREKEERPKLVFGLPLAPDAAREKGLIRDDLHYWLRRGQVDVKAKPPPRR